MKKRTSIQILPIIFVGLFLNACSISYKFTGGSVDYNIYKSISIGNFPNNAELVNPTLSQTFSEALKDKYTRQTRLEVLSGEGGQMHIEGEIVGYQLTSMAISADSYASETKLTLTINVRFSDYKNPEEDFEKRYSANQIFDSNQMLTDVEAELVDEMVKEISDKIFNETVAKW
ncbi:MAG: hypothetical protein CR965_00235 [Paludibacter sp.]|nr:MAG: hypothetical protein CR965_00235 [Paludibacter sp.]